MNTQEKMASKHRALLHQCTGSARREQPQPQTACLLGRSRVNRREDAGSSRTLSALHLQYATLQSTNTYYVVQYTIELILILSSARSDNRVFVFLGRASRCEQRAASAASELGAIEAPKRTCVPAGPQASGRVSGRKLRTVSLTNRTHEAESTSFLLASASFSSLHLATSYSHACTRTSSPTVLLHNSHKWVHPTNKASVFSYLNQHNCDKSPSDPPKKPNNKTT